jgi:hypothetical protein
MGEPPRPRRLPGGALPPRLARPDRPGSNGHAPPPPRQELRDGTAWGEVDAEDEQRLAAERTAFRRVAEITGEARVRASGRPSPAVIAGVLIVVGLVVLAVVLYRMAPP